MVLRDLFKSKPRWRHHNLEVRRQALENLGDERTVLAEIARQDPVPELRMLATQRLTDLATLDQIARSDVNPEVQACALERLGEMLAGKKTGSPSLTERLVWLDRQEVPTLLEKILRHGSEPALRTSVLERTHDEETLSTVAISDPDSRVRSLAASRIQTRSILEQLLKKARTKDKGVYRLVQERLNAILEEEERPRRARIALEAICADLEALLKHGQCIDAPLQRLEDRWKVSGGEKADNDLLARFARGLEAGRGLSLQEKEKKHEQERAEGEFTELRSQKMLLCSTLEDLITELSSQNLSREATGIHDRLRTTVEAWNKLSLLPEAEEVSLKQRFEEAETRIREHLGQWLRNVERIEARRTQCERAVLALSAKKTLGEEKFDQWIREWRALGAGNREDTTEAALLQKFKEATQSLRERIQQEREVHERFYLSAESAVTELERTLEEGTLRSAVPALASAQIALGKLPTGTPRAIALKSRLDIETLKVHRLREWQRWGEGREKERLCVEAEELAQSQEPPEVLSAQVREIRRVWNQLGTTDKEEKLTERFNTACEKAFEPCRAYFAERARIRGESEETREAILKRIDQFKEDQDWMSQTWKELENFVHEIRAAWRNSGGPMSRKSQVTSTERLNAALAPIEGRIHSEHRRILQAKDTLVLRAEALLETPNLRLATRTIKQIQKEWTALGSTPKQGEVQWKRFRAVADAIFAKRAEEIALQESERAAAIASREALCEQVEDLARRNGPELVAAHSECVAFSQQWVDLPAGRLRSEDLSSLEHRFQKAIGNYRSAVKHFQCRQIWWAVESLAEAAALCTELEKHLEGPEDDLRATIEEIQSRWAKTSGSTDPEMIARFERACAQGMNPAKSRRAQLSSDSRTLDILCFRMEILMGLDSPPEAARARLLHQVSRLTEGLHQESKEIPMPQLFLALLKSWYDTPSTQDRGRLEARLANILEAVHASPDYCQ
ncbi:hypothetical protein CCP3SC1AL1_820005 [Gammaproteobacteria bacterium]